MTPTVLLRVLVARALIGARMAGKSLTLLSETQQRIYVDAIFAMAALDGFEIDCTTGSENGDRPVMCAKQIGNYRVEIGWSDEADHGPDPTKAVWDVEVNEYDHGSGGGWKVHLAHVVLHAPDALRIAKGLVGFYHALAQRSRTDTGVRHAAIPPDGR